LAIMGDRLLSGIIELEKTLREEERREAARAAAWRERELAALAAELTAARLALAQRDEDAVAVAREAAEAEGAALLAAGAERCTRLAALPEAFLESLLRRQLGRLLPEADDDHPDGQG
jgi:hypothetical protein